MSDIKLLEKKMDRLLRRSKKVAKVMITPFPISNCIQVSNFSGTALRYMFPASGTILKGGILIDNKPEDAVDIVITITNSIGTTSKTYTMNRRNLAVEPMHTVQAWDRLSIDLIPKGNTVINEAWIAFLWSPDVKEVDIKSCLIEELEKSIVENSEED